jgi:prominin 1
LLKFFRFGVVVAFMTNSYLQQGIENATMTARFGVDDTNTYLNDTSLQINHLLVTNYDELTKNLEKMLNGNDIS